MATQRWPTAWLMTDERLGDALNPALARAAAAGAGILVRHHRSSRDVRRQIGEHVLALGGVLAVARDVALAHEIGAVLVHRPDGSPGALPFSLSVHDEEEALAAATAKPALVFVSPVHPTRSHPGSAALGIEGAMRLAKLADTPAVALGGMDADRGAALIRRGFYGWAGIDCWLRT